jgi:tetratricopeptide (TPR) repeat protein
MQLAVQFNYHYHAEENPEMALKVVRNWVKFYPEDVNAYTVLAKLLSEHFDQSGEAVAIYEKILSIDSTRSEHLKDIGQIYMWDGKFEEAMKYFQLYRDKYPKDPGSYLWLGFLHELYGKHDLAVSNYEKAWIFDPDDISIRLMLANSKAEMGDFNSALSDYEELLNECDSPQERVEVFQRLENYFFLRGQVTKAIDLIELRITEQEKFDTRINILYTKYYSVERYILGGKVNTVLDIAREFEKLGPPHDYMIPWIHLKINLELEIAKEIEKYLEQVEAIIDTTQMEAHRAGTFWARGKLLELNKEYQAAIQHYFQMLDSNPWNIFMHFHIGRCYRMNKEYRNAEEHFQKIIDQHPFWPEELYEFGLVYFEWGKYKKAQEFFNRAQAIWENADPEYKPARELREKLAELEELI